jgi:hypothetical protein
MLPQAPAGLPERLKATGSPTAGAPVVEVTVAVTVDVLVTAAETLAGLAVTLTPAAWPKNPDRSTTRSVEPVLL